MPTTTSEPKIDERPAQPYMGIRKRVPMSKLTPEADKLFKALNDWVEENHLAVTGPRFRRFHVIDMEGLMDVEVGVPVAAALPGSGVVRPGELPAGRYASLVFVGNGYTGNKTLIQWVRAQGLAFDRWDDPEGDAFRSRYESYLTDPAVEPRRTRWQIEVAIKLAD